MAREIQTSLNRVKESTEALKQLIPGIATTDSPTTQGLLCPT